MPKFFKEDSVRLPNGIPEMGILAGTAGTVVNVQEPDGMVTVELYNETMYRWEEVTVHESALVEAEDNQ